MMDPLIPVLSLCFAGRDDNYMLDFKYRVSTCIEHYARSLKSLGRLGQLEIEFVDWGSVAPLSSSLDLSTEGAALCRFLYVSPEIVRRTQAGSDSFHATRSCNAGLRRARGRYLLLGGADQLLPKSSLESLLRLLNGELDVPIRVEDTLMMVPRLQVPWQFVQRKPSLEDWDHFMFFNEYALPREPLPPLSYMFGGAGGIVFSKKIMNRTRGLNEELSNWGMNDVDFGFRVTQEADFVHLNNLGIQFFHMEHPPQVGARAERTVLSNLPWSKVIQANSAGWGLWGEVVVEQRASKHRNPCTVSESQSVENNSAMAPSIDDTVEEIKSPQVFEHVAKVMKALYPTDWADRIESLSGLCLLAWYGAQRLPRRYLEVGLQGPDACAVVVAACPAAQICEVDALEGNLPGKRLSALLSVLIGVGLRSHLHFLNCEMQDIGHRLATLSSGFPDFDLIHLRAERLPASQQNVIRGLLRLLSDGGALVVSRSGGPLAAPEIEALRACGSTISQRVYRSSDGRAAMVLKQQGYGQAISPEVVMETSIDFPVSYYWRAGAAERVPMLRRMTRKLWKELLRVKRLLGTLLYPQKEVSWTHRGRNGK